jgi:nucleoside-diphosphate-sugar epimerase
MKSRLLLTGATGFIGSQTIAGLLERNFEVHAVSSRPNVSLPSPVVYHRVNLLERQSVETLCKQVQASHLLHFAWYVETGHYWNSPKNLAWTAASLQLLQSFAENGGQRAVFSGTCAEQPVEQNITAPAGVYPRCKDSLRRIAEDFCRTAHLSFAWGRIFFLYGPGESRSRLVASAVLSLLDSQKVICKNPAFRRDFMHVRDVANAFVHLLASDYRGTLDIGSGTSVSLKDLVETLATQCKRSDLIELRPESEQAEEPLEIKANPQMLNDLNFRPQFTLAAGLQDSIDWWKNCGKSL